MARKLCLLLVALFLRDNALFQVQVSARALRARALAACKSRRARRQTSLAVTVLFVGFYLQVRPHGTVHITRP